MRGARFAAYSKSYGTTTTNSRITRRGTSSQAISPCSRMAFCRLALSQATMKRVPSMGIKARRAWMYHSPPSRTAFCRSDFILQGDSSNGNDQAVTGRDQDVDQHRAQDSGGLHQGGG